MLDFTSPRPRELRRIIELRFSDPSAGDVQLVPTLETFVFHRRERDRIPVADKAQVLERRRVFAIAHFVQFHQRDDRLEMLVAELGVRLLLKVAGGKREQDEGDGCDAQKFHECPTSFMSAPHIYEWSLLGPRPLVASRSS